MGLLGCLWAKSEPSLSGLCQDSTCTTCRMSFDSSARLHCRNRSGEHWLKQRPWDILGPGFKLVQTGAKMFKNVQTGPCTGQLCPLGYARVTKAPALTLGVRLFLLCETASDKLLSTRIWKGHESKGIPSFDPICLCPGLNVDIICLYVRPKLCDSFASSNSPSDSPPSTSFLAQCLRESIDTSQQLRRLEREERGRKRMAKCAKHILA